MSRNEMGDLCQARERLFNSMLTYCSQNAEFFVDGDPGLTE